MSKERVINRIGVDFLSGLFLYWSIFVFEKECRKHTIGDFLNT